MPEQIKRHVAFKVRIKDIIEGEHVKEEDLLPSYIQIGDNQVSRVNLLGVVVSRPIEQNLSYNSIILDDGSGRISIRSFNDDKVLNHIEIGDVILVIGRPREFGNEKYITPEIIKKIEDKSWIEIRKLELIKPGKKQEQIKKIEEVIQKEKVIEDPAAKIIELIKKNDLGNGADIQEIVNNCKIDNCEKIIKALLETGEIFEMKPGKIKLLE